LQGGEVWQISRIRKQVTCQYSRSQNSLSKLLKRVVAGEEIVIAKSGQPIARLLPYETPQVERQPGSAKGKIWMADDFNAPLPPDILNAFEGK